MHLPAHLAAKLEVYRRSSKLRTKLSHQCVEARLPTTYTHVLEACAPALQRAQLSVASKSCLLMRVESCRCCPSP